MNIEKKAINALILMGAPMKSNGSKYIVDAMRIFDESNEWTSVNTLFLYEEIAKKYNTNPSCVERSIRYIFLKLSSDKNNEYVDKYIGKNSRGNTNRLAVLYIRLKQEAGDEESIY